MTPEKNQSKKMVKMLPIVGGLVTLVVIILAFTVFALRSNNRDALRDAENALNQIENINKDLNDDDFSDNNLGLEDFSDSSNSNLSSSANSVSATKSDSEEILKDIDRALSELNDDDFSDEGLTLNDLTP